LRRRTSISASRTMPDADRVAIQPSLRVTSSAAVRATPVWHRVEIRQLGIARRDQVAAQVRAAHRRA
jgi:hypothetical protein